MQITAFTVCTWGINNQLAKREGDNAYKNIYIEVVTNNLYKKTTYTTIFMYYFTKNNSYIVNTNDLFNIVQYYL